MILVVMQATRFVTSALVGLSVAYAMCQGVPLTSSKQTQLTEHTRRAQQLLAERQPVKAIPELEAIITLDPSNLEAHANLGVLLFFQAQFSSAIPHLKTALELKPDLPKIQSLLGIAERRTGNDSAGRADLEAAFPHIEEDKLRLDVGRDLIDSYSSSGELDKAAQIVSVLLKANPTDPDLLYTSYRIHNDLAVEALLNLGFAAPESGQLHQAMAHELQRERNLPGTIANLRKALALEPSLPGIHFELAEALHASDDQRLRAESLEHYKLAVQVAPTDPKAATRLGDIQVEQGDLTAASTAYRQALQIRANYPDAEIGLANLLVKQGKFTEAATLLENVESVDPTNSLAHYRLSAVYRQLKRPEDVKRELALYERYKDEREKLKLIYQGMRSSSPADGPPR